MMVTADSLDRIVSRAMDEIAPILSAPLPDGGESASRLFGKGGLLDSLSLIHLIVSIEEGVANEFGVSVSLTDPDSLSEAKSPFKDLESLKRFVADKINDKR